MASNPRTEEIIVKVLALLHLYRPVHQAGAEVMVHTMLRELVKQGHEVVVQLSQKHKEITSPYEFEGVKILPSTHKSNVFDNLHNSDIILSHLENTARATTLGRMYKIPVVHVLHNTHFQSKKWLQPDVRLAVYNSEWMKEDYEKFLKDNRMQPARHIIVRPPVDVKEYKTKPGNKVTLVNLYEPKGSNTFYALARRMPDVEFLGVIGAYGDQVLEDLPNVTILGHTPDAKKDIYGQTKILLVPSEYESWGRVGVEAMCSGIPVIAHPTPGLKESLGAAGTFHDRNDIDSWEASIHELLKPTKYKEASKKAKARAKELDPSEDLARFCEVMEVIGRGTSNPRRR